MLKTPEVEQWLKSAQDDLESAKIISREKAPFWVACFHAQQAAEKALKAMQIYYLKQYRKEHDLEVLLKSLAGHFDTSSISEEAEKLTDYYVSTRYPGIKESELTSQDAEQAVKMAEKVLKLVNDLLR